MAGILRHFEAGLVLLAALLAFARVFVNQDKALSRDATPVLLVITAAVTITYSKGKKGKYREFFRGSSTADTGVLLGSAIWPLVFLAQMLTIPESRDALCHVLRYCTLCSAAGLMYFYSSGSPGHFSSFIPWAPYNSAPTRPNSWECWMWNVLLLLAGVVGSATTSDWLPEAFAGVFLCVLFLQVANFMIERMKKCFTPGEVIAAATFVSVMACNVILTTMSKLLRLLLAQRPILSVRVADNLLTVVEAVSDQLVALLPFRFESPMFQCAQALLGGAFALGALLLPQLRAVYTEAESRAHRPISSADGVVVAPRLLRALYVRLAVFVAVVFYPWMWLMIGSEPFQWISSVLFEHGAFSLPIPALLCGCWLLMILAAVALCAPNREVSASNPDSPSVATRAASSSRSPAGAADRKERTKERWPAPSALKPKESASRSANIISRKFFHLLALLMFLPALLIQARFLALAFAVALAVFVLLEILRVARAPPVGTLVQAFMQRYIDVRDFGVSILSHIYLLVGCALPLWLHVAQLQPTSSVQSDKASEVTSSAGFVFNSVLSLLPAASGILILGAGDALASLVGSRFGLLHWPSSRRTVEGTLAGAAVVGLAALVLWLFESVAINFAHVQLIEGRHGTWFGFGLATVMTCLLEACTDQIDNFFLPLFYYAVLLVAG